MKFYSDKYLVPELYQTDQFLFRPLRATDVELDFDAVISSSALLREWSQSDWPRDGFTLEENLDDLQRHEQEHLDKVAFTYTIMNSDETLCLGCIYINPLLQEMVDLGACQFRDKVEEAFVAMLSFWVRQSRSTREFNATILENIVQWLDREWYFDCVAFPVAPGDSIQSSLFVEKGFAFVGEITIKKWQSRWRLYQR